LSRMLKYMRGETINKAVITIDGTGVIIPIKTEKGFLKFNIVCDAKTVVNAKKEVTYLVPKDLPRNIIRMMLVI